MPAAVSEQFTTPVPAAPAPLENGDHLTTPEFLRRYETRPDLKKAELIEGIVYLGSPVRIRSHAAPDSLISAWLGLYAAHTPGTLAAANGTVQLDLDNAPQPDSLLLILPECGGQTRFDASDYLIGAPELVVEVAASSRSIDTREKLAAYRRNGVREYLIWRTLDRQFDWFCLTGGEYRELTRDARGVLRSRIFPGLCLDVTALLASDGAQVLATQQGALNSSEHTAFIARLATRRTR